MRHFRQEAKMCGEDEYYFTTIESAVEFIANLSETYKTDLKLTESEQVYFSKRLSQPVPEPMSIDDMLTKSFEETKAQEQKRNFASDPSLLTDTDDSHFQKQETPNKLLPGFDEAFEAILSTSQVEP